MDIWIEGLIHIGALQHFPRQTSSLSPLEGELVGHAMKLDAWIRAGRTG
jgi:hypothetical protein